MQLHFFLGGKSVFQFASRISSPYFARGHIFRNYSARCDDSPLSYPHAGKDNSPMPNPYVIANDGFVVR